MTTGIIGVPLGSYLSQRFNRKYPRADPYICAVGLILSAPLLAGAMLTVSANATLAYVLVFFGELALNLNWAIVADILLVRTLVRGERERDRKYSLKEERGRESSRLFDTLFGTPATFGSTRTIAQSFVYKHNVVCVNIFSFCYFLFCFVLFCLWLNPFFSHAVGGWFKTNLFLLL